MTLQDFIKIIERHYEISRQRLSKSHSVHEARARNEQALQLSEILEMARSITPATPELTWPDGWYFWNSTSSKWEINPQGSTSGDSSWIELETGIVCQACIGEAIRFRPPIFPRVGKPMADEMREIVAAEQL